jgi:hypothetical protein
LTPAQRYQLERARRAKRGLPVLTPRADYGKNATQLAQEATDEQIAIARALLDKEVARIMERRENRRTSRRRADRPD